MTLWSIFSRKTALRTCAIITTATAVVLASLLMGSHTPFVVRPASRRETARSTGHWQAIHILGADCPCSRRIAKHLAQRKQLSELNEHIVLVGDDRDSERILRQGGWQVERTSADQVRDLYGAISAPLLFFIDPRGSIHYKGGYARRSDARDGFHEAEIWDALRAGRIVSPLPAYGCALTFGCYVGALRQAAARLE